MAQAQQLEESVVVIWMASWCRKCIYLKPKLEKLAAEYYPRLLFYSVDVNSVPLKLVARAEVTKMPIIQLWKDGKKQAEVVGGHKSYLVVNEVREMIENEDDKRRFVSFVEHHIANQPATKSQAVILTEDDLQTC